MTRRFSATTALLMTVGLVIALLTALIANPATLRAEISISASLAPTTFAVDDGAQLSITVNGTRSADIELPETDTGSFEIFQRGRSSQFNMVNGEFSSAVTFTCIVRAYRPGTYTIPPIAVEADGQKRSTDPIPFEVTGNSPPAPGSSGTAAAPPNAAVPSDAGQAAFLRLAIPRQQGYVGEIIPVQVKAYFRQGLRASLNSAPALVGDGLVMPQLNEKPVQTEEQLGSNRYSVLTWQTELSTIKEGSHRVHLELEATLLIPERRMSTSMFGRRSPFDDDLFDSFFGGYREKPIKAVSGELPFAVLPLPRQNRPAGFTGAIGDFNMQVSAAPVEAETGEPLTLTVTISGTGNFDRVEPPSFPDSANWKTYSPSAAFTAQQGRAHAGSKVFERAIVAKNDGVTEIPALAFSYFDPATGKYVTLESAAIPITIHGKAATTAQSSPPAPAATVSPPSSTQPPKSQPAPQLLSGLAPLRLEPGKTTASIAPLYTRPLVIAIIVICLTILAVVAVLKTLRRRLDRPEEVLRRERAKLLADSLAEIQQALAAGDSSVFLGVLRSAIQHHLGAIWHCPAAAITSADLATRLPASSRLLEIFTVAEQAAYSGMVLKQATMADYAKAVAAELEKLP